MHARPSFRAVLAAGLLAAAGGAQALTCSSGVHAGTVEFRCSQPEAITSACRWSAELEADDGSKGVRSGTFLLPPRARDLTVVSEDRFGGRRIVRGQAKLEQCAIGLTGPLAAEATAELARARARAASAASAASPASAPRRGAP